MMTKSVMVELVKDLAHELRRVAEIGDALQSRINEALGTKPQAGTVIVEVNLGTKNVIFAEYANNHEAGASTFPDPAILFKHNGRTSKELVDYLVRGDDHRSLVTNGGHIAWLGLKKAKFDDLQKQGQIEPWALEKLSFRIESYNRYHSALKWREAEALREQGDSPLADWSRYQVDPEAPSLFD